MASRARSAGVSRVTGPVRRYPSWNESANLALAASKAAAPLSDVSQPRRRSRLNRNQATSRCTSIEGGWRGLVDDPRLPAGLEPDVVGGEVPVPPGRRADEIDGVEKPRLDHHRSRHRLEVRAHRRRVGHQVCHGALAVERSQRVAAGLDDRCETYPPCRGRRRGEASQGPRPATYPMQMEGGTACQPIGRAISRDDPASVSSA